MTQYLTTSCYKKRPPKKILIPASLWSGWRNPSKREGSSRQITTWLGKQTKGDKTTKLWEQDVKICIFQTLELFSDWGAVARHGGLLHLLGSRSLHQVCGLWSCLWTDCSHTHQEIQVLLSSTASSYASISVSCTISKVFLNFALLLQGS